MCNDSEIDMCNDSDSEFTDLRVIPNVSYAHVAMPISVIESTARGKPQVSRNSAPIAPV